MKKSKKSTDSAFQMHLIDRAGDLKGMLVEFGHGPRFKKEMDRARRKHFGGSPPEGQYDFIRFLDWFLLEYRLPDSRLVVDIFVEEHPDLPEVERKMLLGWKDVVEGYFEVSALEGGSLAAANLMDDMTYRIRPNRGPGFIEQFAVGSFFMSRVVPVGTEWIFSGAQQVWNASQKEAVYEMVRKEMMDLPHLVFRNPEKLALARKIQSEDYREFVAFFGSDLVALPAEEFQKRMHAYMRYKAYEVRDENGLTRAERAVREGRTIPPFPEFDLPGWGRKIATIGIIYDEAAGQYFWPDFHLIEKAFADPDLIRTHAYRDAVMSYLQDPAMPPFPIRRLAEAYPDNADRLFRKLFKLPKFTWPQDGEKLLRRYKAEQMDHPPLPSLLPISDPITGKKAGD